MSMESVRGRIARYEARRHVRWLLLVGLLWVAAWLGAAVLFSMSPMEESATEAELLVEEAHFYPIDL